MKQDNAFTGLEAAIVLIAFVVVAAIFSYILLGAGFFATQKAQEVTYAGVKQTVSNAVIDGSMYANVTGNKLNGFTFNVRIPLGGEAIDMNKTTFLYTSSNQPEPVTIRVNKEYNGNVGTAVNFIYPRDDGCTNYPCVNVFYPRDADGLNTVLTSGQFATFMVSIASVIDPSSKALKAKDWFTLEMRPRIGAATLVTKTIASGLQGGEVL